MRKTRFGPSLPLPYFGDFLETNVRLYSIDDELVGASGARIEGPRLRALFSPGVHARFGRPRLVV